MSNWLLYVVTVLVWGTTWIAIEFQIGDVAPEVSVFYRYLFAAVLLFGWCLLRNLQLRFNLRAHSRFVLFGLLLFSLNYIVTYHAQLHPFSYIIFKTLNSKAKSDVSERYFEMSSAVIASAFSCFALLNLVLELRANVLKLHGDLAPLVE